MFTHIDVNFDVKYEGHQNFFFFNFCRTQVLFVGPLIPLFWTSGDVCPGFQSQGGFLACTLSCLCASPQIHLWCDTCWLYRGQHGSQSHSLHATEVAAVGWWDGIWSRDLLHSMQTHYPLGHCNQRRSPKFVKNTFYGQLEGFWWWSYVTSKLMSICLNLIISIYFFVKHLFDNLTSFNIFYHLHV